MPEEREIKLSVPDHFTLPDLDAAGPGVRAIDRGTRRLDAMYWDTDRLELIRAGIGLRHRAAEGESGSWTLKGGSRREGDAVVRAEDDFPGPPDAPPAAVLDALRSQFGTVLLRPVARLITLRHTVDLMDAGGSRRAEIAADQVTVLSGDTVVDEFAEAEVEVFDAEPELVDTVIARLRASGAGAAHVTSKYVRALLALGHELPKGDPE